MPCKRLKPVVEEYVENNVDVAYKPINVDVDFEIAKTYNIMSVPTLVILKDGIEISRHTGLANYDKINSLVNG
jgi:thioredoxin 1